MLKTSKIILYYTILYIFLVCIANGKFFEKVMLLFPRFYIVKENFEYLFPVKKKKSEKNQQKLSRVVTGQKWKNEQRRKESWQNKIFFLKFFACKKWVFAVYRHTFTFTKKLTPSFRDLLFSYRVKPAWNNRKLHYY